MSKVMTMIFEHPDLSLNTVYTGWRDGSPVKSTYSFRGLRLNSQYPYGTQHHSVPGDSTSKHTVHLHVYRQNIHAHK